MFLLSGVLPGFFFSNDANRRGVPCHKSLILSPDIDGEKYALCFSYHMFGPIHHHILALKAVRTCHLQIYHFSIRIIVLKALQKTSETKSSDFLLRLDLKLLGKLCLPMSRGEAFSSRKPIQNHTDRPCEKSPYLCRLLIALLTIASVQLDLLIP